MRHVRLGNHVSPLPPFHFPASAYIMSVVRFQTFPSLATFFYLSPTRCYEKYDFSQATLCATRLCVAENCKLSGNNVSDNTNVVELTSNARSPDAKREFYYANCIFLFFLRLKFMFRNLRIRVKLNLLTSAVITNHRTCKCHHMRLFISIFMKLVAKKNTFVCIIYIRKSLIINFFLN